VKGRNTVFEVVDGKAMVVGGAGVATAPLIDGKFPRWRDVFGDTSAHKQIGVKPELLIDVLAVFKAAGVEGVRVYIGDAENGPSTSPPRPPPGKSSGQSSCPCLSTSRRFPVSSVRSLPPRRPIACLTLL
jgi:hypothetical protein